MWRTNFWSYHLSSGFLITRPTYQSTPQYIIDRARVRFAGEVSIVSRAYRYGGIRIMIAVSKFYYVWSLGNSRDKNLISITRVKRTTDRASLIPRLHTHVSYRGSSMVKANSTQCLIFTHSLFCWGWTESSRRWAHRRKSCPYFPPAGRAGSWPAVGHTRKCRRLP